jgi:hypothetical protein
MPPAQSDRIKSRLKEERRFPPSQAFSDRARLSSHAAYESLYRKSLEEPEEFWREQTADLVWREASFAATGPTSRGSMRRSRWSS